MKVIKNINNNVSLCLDSKGNEVVAFGKGIGFMKPPYEVPLSKIQKTFYDINPAYFTIIAEMPEEIILLSTEIVDEANRKLENTYSSNVVFTLADHIQFAMERKKTQMHLKLPLLYEVRHLYPQEMKIGESALKRIEKTLHVTLPEEEAASIALHLVNFGKAQSSVATKVEKTEIEKVTEFIEQKMKIKIDKSGYNYFRFVTHMHYLLDRIKENKMISSQNQKLLEAMRKEYPKIYECAMSIRDLLHKDFNDEELLYLILHINRLCSREDCYQ